MKQALFPLAIASICMVASCEKTAEKIATAGDATFARTTFEALARGDQAVNDSIDWNTFNAMGQNVGALYVSMASAEDQRRFREGFITQFSSSFQQAGGRVEEFTDWKVASHDATHTRVTAMAPTKILTITVNERDGKERVSGLEVADVVTR